MSYNITFSRYHEELIKEAEELLKKEEKMRDNDDYIYEIVLVPTAVVYHNSNKLKEGRPGIIYHPNNELIRK